MGKMLSKVIIVATILGLAGCSTLPMGSKQVNDERHNRADVGVGEQASTVGGSIQKTMDVNDKTKMFRALDKPVGKPTQWTNQYTRVSYTVLPVKKLSVNGNPFCRQYRVTSVKNAVTQEINGTACVSATDSSWQVVN